MRNWIDIKEDQINIVVNLDNLHLDDFEGNEVYILGRRGSEYWALNKYGEDTYMSTFEVEHMCNQNNKHIYNGAYKRVEDIFVTLSLMQVQEVGEELYSVDGHNFISSWEFEKSLRKEDYKKVNFKIKGETLQEFKTVCEMLIEEEKKLEELDV